MNQTHSISKAVIPVAGWGTRRLPVAKAIEKCMLPVCNRPIIDYAVEECLQAGITDIFFVVSPDFEQLRSYYTASVPLEEYLASRGKLAMLEELQKIPYKANFHYIVQDPAGPYGTAVPVWVARDAVASDDLFAMCFGDDFIYTPDGSSEMARLVAAVTERQTAGGMLGIEMDDEHIGKYASIKTRPGKGGACLDGLVEKPAPGTAPTNLASVSYYVFSNTIMPFIEEALREPNEHGEHFLTDPVTAFVAAGNDMAVVTSKGCHLDGGNLEDWIEANNVMFVALKEK